MSKNKESKAKRKVSGMFKHDKLGQSKANLAKAATNTLIDVGVMFVGSLAGAALGTFSLPAGALLTGTGYYFDNTLVSRFGLGMASSTVVGSIADALQGTKPQKAGLEGIVDNAVHRVEQFANNLERKTGVDKVKAYLSKDKQAQTGAAGFGRVYTEEIPFGGFGNLPVSEQEQNQKLVEFQQKFETAEAQNQQAVSFINSKGTLI